jgi:hypothetical protein
LSLAKSQWLAERAAEIRKSDPLIDWSGVKGEIGQRRIALWASELKNIAPHRLAASG